MDDRVDAFARLNRLRTEGILTDAEYEREKTALMGEDGLSDLSPSQRWADGWEATSGMRRSLRWSLIGCVIVVALIGTYFFGKARTLAEARGELSSSTQVAIGTSTEGGSLFGSESAWAIQTTTDPMTDVTTSTASATIEGSQFNFEVGVSCSNTGEITYMATSFDKAGKPAEMRRQADWQRSWIPFQIRADDNQPLSWSTSNPAYNNQISLKSEPVQFYGGKPTHDRAEGIAEASKVVLRLFMPTGEETIEWSQTDSALHDLIAPCLSHREAKRTELTAERNEFDRKTEAEVEQRRQDRIRENVRQGRPADDTLYAI